MCHFHFRIANKLDRQALDRLEEALIISTESLPTAENVWRAVELAALYLVKEGRIDTIL